MAKQAIEGKRKNAFAREPETLTIVGLDTDEGPEVAGWDERVRNGRILSTITDEWVANISRLGVLKPILCRKNGDRVDVIAGRRRVLGARVANARRKETGEPPILVTVVLRDGTDADAFEAMVAENQGRVDDPPTVLAEKMARMVRLHGATNNDLAVVFQMKPAQVAQHLALLELSDKVQKLVADRTLAVGAALTLRDLPRSEQESKAHELVAAGGTVAEARRQKRVRAKPEAADEETEVRGKRPSVSVLRKLAENEAFIAGLSPEARHMLHFCSGNEASIPRIKGLVAALREIGK